MTFLIEIAHAGRDPIILKATGVIARGLAKQLRSLLVEALPRLKQHVSSLKEADEDERAINEVVSGLRALSDSIALEKYGELLQSSLIAGANQTGGIAGKTYVTWPDRVQGWLNDHALEKIGRGVDATTIERLRDILAEGLAEHRGYAQIARSIRASALFGRARAELISVTEIGNAFSQGSLAAAMDLEAEGSTVEKSWLSQDTACDICSGNSGAGWIDVGKAFPSGHDAPLGHPRCLCALLTRIAVSVAA